MDKVVYVKTVEQLMGKNGPYRKVTDQSGENWNIFSRFKDFPLEAGKAYLINYTQEGKYPEISEIRRLENVFMQAAVKQVSNANDVIKNRSVSMSYAVNLCIGGKIDLPQLEAQADKILEYVTKVEAHNEN